MTTQLDLSLPQTVPDAARYHDQSLDLHPAALYTLVDLSDAELQELQRVCESECEGDAPSVRLAPRPRFIDSPLRAVLDYHLELGRQEHSAFYPTYFIVAIERDWRTHGVLLVTLDDDDLECKPDAFRIKASDSGLSFVNLQIANSSWSEEKECCAITDGDGDDASGGGPNDDDDNDNDGDEDNGEDQDDDSGPECPPRAPPLGYHIGVYVREGIDAEALILSLEPGANYKQREDFVCQLQAVIPAAVDTVERAFALHPVRCRKNRWLHKELFLVADADPPAQHGLVLAHLSWDGVTKGKSTAALHAVAPNAMRKTQRVPANALEGVQHYFINTASGIRAWKCDHPLVAVFQYNVGNKERGFGATLLDPQHNRRADGDERVVYAPNFVRRKGTKPDHVQWSFDEAVRRFPWLCREHRFEGNFVRNYFLCVDSEDVAKNGVLLVRVDWNRDVTKSDEDLLAMDLRDNVATLRIPAKDAYSILYAGLEGTTSNLSQEANDFFHSQS